MNRYENVATISRADFTKLRRAALIACKQDKIRMSATGKTALTSEQLVSRLSPTDCGATTLDMNIKLPRRKYDTD